MTDFNKDIQYRLEEYLNNITRMAVNGFIKNPNTPPEMINKYSGATTKVKFLKSTNDEGDPQDYISNQDTCFNHLEYELDIKLLDGITEKYVGVVKVPYMMNNGSFIIDGKLRIATNNLNMTYDCSYIPDNHKFQLNNVAFFINDNNITASYRDVDGNHSKRITSQADLESLGMNLEFTEDQLLKLYFLTDTQFDEQVTFPKSLTYEFLVNLPRIKGIDTRRDSVTNVKISSISDSLIEYINEWQRGQGPKAKILGDIKKELFYPGKGKSPSLVLGSVFTYCMRFFRQASKSGIDIASVVNPLVFDQLHNKIKMPKYIPYTMQFSDLIDAPNTPENGNVNIINELNVCIYHNDTDGIGIYCYQYPYGDKVGVKYNEYINQLALRYDEWDYTENKLKNPFKDKYKVKYHTYTIELSANELSKVKYIEPKIDDKFSISSRTIPFLNSSDSVRIAMGAGMVKQSVELERPEDPIISSGNTEIDSEGSSMNTYASDDGIIIMKDGELGVKYDSGSFQAFPKSISGMNYITISHSSLVNPGDKVVKGQKLTTATTANGGYKLGLNALVFYLNYLGQTYEDGIVVSQSFADRLTHWTLHDVVINIYYGDEIDYIASLGDRVNSGDELFKSTSNPINIEGKDLNITESKKDKILSKLTNITSVPSNITDGVIIAASYELNNDWAKKNKPGKAEFDATSGEVIAGFMDSISNPSDKAKSNIESVPSQYRNQKLGRTFRWIAQNKFGQSIIGVIRFKIAVRRPLIIGDKLCNRYGSKGMVSCIIPDDCRPYYIDEYGEKVFADIIANPASIVSRKNSSQLHEALLSRVVRRIYEMAKSAKNDEELESVLNIIKDIYKDQHKDLTLEGLKGMIESGLPAFKIFVGTFHEGAYEYVVSMANKLGITESEEVYAPSVSVHENKDLSSNVGLEVRCIENEDGSIDDSKRFSDGRDYILGWLDQPLVVGYNFYMKLYHSAVWSGSVTPTRDSAKNTILGKGKIRKTGQSISEMEKWALQATGASEIYQDPVRSPNYESSQYEFLNTLLRGGYELT